MFVPRMVEIAPEIILQFTNLSRVEFETFDPPLDALTPLTSLRKLQIRNMEVQFSELVKLQQISGIRHQRENNGGRKSREESR
jgi:hypothetical protein